jgi:hypothetical protein
MRLRAIPIGLVVAGLAVVLAACASTATGHGSLAAGGGAPSKAPSTAASVIAPAPSSAGGGASTAPPSSSGGGGSVDPTALQKKIESDPSIGAVLTSVPSSLKAPVLSCITKVLLKDTNQTQLQEYVQGKLSLAQVEGAPGVTDAQIQQDSQSCVLDAVGSAVPSGIPS